MQTLSVITLGCSKNTVDTEHLLAAVERHFIILPEGSLHADVLLVNTCGFIGDAKEESVNVILQAVQAKQGGDVGKIIVFGCLSQRYESELREEIPEVDLWFGARDLAPVVKALGVEVPDDLETERHLVEDKPYAFLKISEGCDRRCSYCAIPFIRGAHRSVPMETLVEEARHLAAKGVRELEIIAQDTTFYGLDLYGRRRLGDLLQSLSEVEGIDWLRIHYSYPSDFPEDVLDIMASNPKVCRYMDIPLQHISDSVLADMHRGVDGKRTRELIGRMREKVPGVVFRTTLIVGFPGETEQDFEQLLDFVHWARFERLGAFKYSEEEGTWGAENLCDDIPEEIKQQRLDRLMEVQAEISRAYNESRIGSVVRVLADSWQDGVLQCRSMGESPDVDGEIFVRGERCRVGTMFDVRISEADVYDLEGEII